MSLGDSHNLGRAVSEDNNGYIIKPRPVFWEWLFLSIESPLRLNLQKLYNEKGYNLASFLPKLKINILQDQSLFLDNKVEKLQLNESFSLLSSITEQFGKLLGFCSWFGLTDLHFENIKMGLNKKGTFVCTPIDIECIFEDLELISQTQIIKSKDSINSNLGCLPLLEKNLNVAEICEYFLIALKFIEDNKAQICQGLEKIDFIGEVPIRVVIKPTRTYFGYINKSICTNSFHKDELVQLDRGDIPYFFHTLNDKRLKYFSNDGALVVSELSRKNSKVLPVFIDSISDFETRFLAINFIKNSICQICRTFDAKIDQVFESKRSRIEFKGKKIYMDLPNKWRMSCRRF